MGCKVCGSTYVKHEQEFRLQNDFWVGAFTALASRKCGTSHFAIIIATRFHQDHTSIYLQIRNSYKSDIRYITAKHFLKHTVVFYIIEQRLVLFLRFT